MVSLLPTGAKPPSPAVAYWRTPSKLNAYRRWHRRAAERRSSAAPSWRRWGGSPACSDTRLPRPATPKRLRSVTYAQSGGGSGRGPMCRLLRRLPKTAMRIEAQILVGQRGRVGAIPRDRRFERERSGGVGEGPTRIKAEVLAEHAVLVHRIVVLAQGLDGAH